ncbi:hypothetical protein ACFL96_09655 [Thermoproteota archaeon]
MQYSKNLISLALILSSLVISSGCTTKPPSDLEKSDIENVFLESFKTKSTLGFPVDINTTISGKTFWIYIATEKDILTISPASSMGGVAPEKIIKFLEVKCDYKDSYFVLDYIFLKYAEEEIAKEKDILKKSVGGTMLYQDFTDTTIEVLQKTYSSIGDIVSDVDDLNFFAISLANIKKGLMITFIIHKLDMEQFLLGMLPSDEFYNRMIMKTEGNKDIINDKYGLHTEYNDISLTNFLREQIVNHSRATINELERYEPEKIKTIDKLDDILIEDFYKVTTKYEFQDYLFLEVNNIISKEKVLLSKSKLERRFYDPPESYTSEEYNF